MVMNMRNKRILALLLALVLLTTSILTPVKATEGEAPPDEIGETQEGETADASGGEVTEETEPTVAEPIVQQGFSGPVASDIGIDAMSALGGPQDFDVDGEAALLYELTSGTMVYAKNIDVIREPASMTKVMTALLALEHGNLEDDVVVSAEALAGMDPDSSSSGLMVGEKLTLEQLLYCLLVESAGDAALVIAIHIGGTMDNFVELMNRKAQELGCTNTHFENPHGLHGDEHYSCARDIGKIMMAALEYSKFQEIYSTSRYVLPATNLHDERIMVTTNYLIGTAVTKDYYDSRVIGGKTGFTTPAGRCVVCVAEDKDLQYLCVVMGASSEITSTYARYGSFQTATRLFDFGFDNFTFAEVLSPLAPVAQLSVADTTESVVVTPAEALTTMLPEGYTADQLRTEYVLNSENGLTAPLEAGEVVGLVREFYEDICVGETDLITMTAVTRRPVASATNQVVEKIEESPWKTVVLVLAAVLLVLILFLLGSAWYRAVRRKRRRKNRRIRR